MPPTLRKRKAPDTAPAPPPKKAVATARKRNKVATTATATGNGASDADSKRKKAAADATTTATAPENEASAFVAAANNEEKPDAPAAAAPLTGGSGKIAVGDIVSLDGFGDEVETNDGTKTTLKQLVDESKSGVVLFTYPKASTPGCTKQACFFRDEYKSLTGGGLAIYGLSADSPKANTTFRIKQNLPYPLLCDPGYSLIGAIGLKKSPRGVQRGIFVVNKAGKVLIAEPGSPAGTLERVKALVKELKL